MIIFKTLSARNFLSIGNVTQTITFTNAGVTLILGENLDLGGGDSKNGVGKTTIVNALCYALYGLPLVNIKRENLINHTNQKGMFVSVEYTIDGKEYRIERGRKPNFLRYYVNNGIVNEPDSNESAGESKWTQVEIEKAIGGLSHSLFKHIIALHTKMVPFLSMKELHQREIIEELLGITQLSNKAEQLKEQIKQVRDEVKDEEVRIKTVLDSNDKVQNHINDLKFKSQLWEREHNRKIEKLTEAISRHEHINIEKEISAHKIYNEWQSLDSECLKLQNEAVRIDRALEKLDDQFNVNHTQLFKLNERSCPMCNQTLQDDQHENILNAVTAKNEALFKEQTSLKHELQSVGNLLENKWSTLASMGEQPTRAYKTLEEALNHRYLLDSLLNNKQREQTTENPYFEQIANLSASGLQSVSYDYLNELSRLKEHQDFLIKLLTSKESFIRKKIIDQNLSYLNRRLNIYLAELALPHEVIFQSDLTVEIINTGIDNDFDQLSSGEANRLTLALAWAFRDMWESMNSQINLLVIDELIDSGMDKAGTESSLDLLNGMAREKNKNIFLISHKEGLESRVDNVLLVQKENNFTSFSDSSME